MKAFPTAGLVFCLLVQATSTWAQDVVLYSNAVDDAYLEAGTSDGVGDQILWNSPLEQADGTVVGRNAGHCVRVDAEGNFVCTMTLDQTGVGRLLFSGVQVVEPATSELMITAGTGDYAGATGIVLSTPVEDRARFRFDITFFD